MFISANEGKTTGSCKITKNSGDILDGICKTSTECYYEKGEALSPDNESCGYIKSCCTRMTYSYLILLYFLLYALLYLIKNIQ